MSRELIQNIHESPLRIVLAITGGGSLAMSDLLRVPGASRTILEAIVPYSSAALVDFLGYEPEQYCSRRTARRMASRAFWRAVELVKQSGDARLAEVPLAGIACTASLASDRPKRGQHRAHIGVQTKSQTEVLTVEFMNPDGTREEEEMQLADAILAQVADCCGLEVVTPKGLNVTWTMSGLCTEAQPRFVELYLKQKSSVLIGPESLGECAIFPGAFDPLHDGHRRMAQLASQRMGIPVAYEISIMNVDKPPLDYIDMESRAKQFVNHAPLYLTRCPTFVEKAAVFPGKTFVVGADTIRRVGDARYYAGDASQRDAAIDRIAQLGCRFLVFGRASDGRF
ncbi:MAG: CinA family protein, partial [Planctomycetales bacterium]|nr:CinA family protein [Planctomycetales bacterium]